MEDRRGRDGDWMTEVWWNVDQGGARGGGGADGGASVGKHGVWSGQSGFK